AAGRRCRGNGGAARRVRRHRRAPGELSSSGRGLVLLDLLAHRWNIRPEPEGKTVWFEIDEEGPEEP
ncbi:hypothetical protein ACWCOW_39035, partial [Streptomyces sp. NPDC001939]